MSSSARLGGRRSSLRVAHRFRGRRSIFCIWVYVCVAGAAIARCLTWVGVCVAGADLVGV